MKPHNLYMLTGAMAYSALMRAVQGAIGPALVSIILAVALWYLAGQEEASPAND
jgi:hypothetical protein